MSVSWMKTGEESEELAQREKKAAEARQAEQGKAFRYGLKVTGSSPTNGQILFLDGALNPKAGNKLTPLRFYEHTVMHQGNWGNYICPEQSAPQNKDRCPICEGKDKPALVSVFSVLDLVPYTTKAGNILPFTRKLFVAKPRTMDILQSYAMKRGGLTGWIVDTTRATSKDASVGSAFDFQHKVDPAEAAKKYVRTYKKDGAEVTESLFAPLDYAKELVFRTGDELRALGFGAPVAMGGMGGGMSAPQAAASDDYDSHL